MRYSILIFSIFCVSIACTGKADSTNDAEPIRIADLSPGSIYSEEDFDVSGVKINKSYDVSGLPMAISATRIIFDKKYVEVRLYESPDSANNEGKTYAESVTGPDAVVSGNSVMWKEKERDRRKCVPKAGLTEAGCDQVARYGGFIISGNLILLCEGLDRVEAQDLCLQLINHLDE